jgi:hypothetical protein
MFSLKAQKVYSVDAPYKADVKVFVVDAEITNVSINTALGRMRYALINLKKILEKNNAEIIQ